MELLEAAAGCPGSCNGDCVSCSCVCCLSLSRTPSSNAIAARSCVCSRSFVQLRPRAMGVCVPIPAHAHACCVVALCVCGSLACTCPQGLFCSHQAYNDTRCEARESHFVLQPQHNSGPAVCWPHCAHHRYTFTHYKCFLHRLKPFFECSSIFKQIFSGSSVLRTHRAQTIAEE